jgi:hypothetical protein
MIWLMIVIYGPNLAFDYQTFQNEADCVAAAARRLGQPATTLSRWGKDDRATITYCVQGYALEPR